MVSGKAGQRPGPVAILVTAAEREGVGARESSEASWTREAERVAG